jgi:uncharacterized protein YecT (DUF1311 family)
VSGRAAAAILSASLSLAAAAQAATPLQDCYARHATRIEVGECLKKWRRAAEAELREAYDKAGAAAREAGRARDSGAPLGALQRSQKAWIAYRDAQCRLAYEMMMPGTGAGDAASDCTIRLTEERTRALRALVE